MNTIGAIRSGLAAALAVPPLIGAVQAEATLRVVMHSDLKIVDPTTDLLPLMTDDENVAGANAEPVELSVHVPPQPPSSALR